MNTSKLSTTLTSSNKHHPPSSLKTLSLILISIIITSLLYYNHLLGFSFNTHFNQLSSLNHPTHSPSQSVDYNKYVWSKNILSNWQPNSRNRLIAIGDIHGMLHSFKTLLKHLNYDPTSDTVVLIGDLAAKHPSIESSLHTIRFCRQSKLEAVRGNHDQYIIIWRNWMEAHRNEFIEPEHVLTYQSDAEATLESDRWLETPEPPRKLKHKLPEGMKWKAQHFEIARRLPKVDFLWMLDRSLTIYVSPLKTFFVHAGMLPWNLPGTAGNNEDASEEHLLLDVEENKDPYTLLEMRGLKKRRKPTRSGKKGRPWYKYWNNVMAQCNQTSQFEDSHRQPHHVVYGHWAAKGLTIKPWSIGLDSGCVFGRQLSALVIGQENTIVEKHEKFKTIPVPIHHQNAKVVQMPCRKP